MAKARVEYDPELKKIYDIIKDTDTGSLATLKETNETALSTLESKVKNCLDTLTATDTWNDAVSAKLKSSAESIASLIEKCKEPGGQILTMTASDVAELQAALQEYDETLKDLNDHIDIYNELEANEPAKTETVKGKDKDGNETSSTREPEAHKQWKKRLEEEDAITNIKQEELDGYKATSDSLIAQLKGILSDMDSEASKAGLAMKFGRTREWNPDPKDIDEKFNSKDYTIKGTETVDEDGNVISRTYTVYDKDGKIVQTGTIKYGADGKETSRQTKNDYGEGPEAPGDVTTSTDVDTVEGPDGKKYKYEEKENGTVVIRDEKGNVVEVLKKEDFEKKYKKPERTLKENEVISVEDGKTYKYEKQKDGKVIIRDEEGNVVEVLTEEEFNKKYTTTPPESSAPAPEETAPKEEDGKTDEKEKDEGKNKDEEVEKPEDKDGDKDKDDNKDKDDAKDKDDTDDKPKDEEKDDKTPKDDDAKDDTKDEDESKDNSKDESKDEEIKDDITPKEERGEDDSKDNPKDESKGDDDKKDDTNPKDDDKGKKNDRSAGDNDQEKPEYSETGGKDGKSYTSREDAINSLVGKGISRERAEEIVDEAAKSGNTHYQNQDDQKAADEARKQAEEEKARKTAEEEANKKAEEEKKTKEEQEKADREEAKKRVEEEEKKKKEEEEAAAKKAEEEKKAKEEAEKKAKEDEEYQRIQDERKMKEAEEARSKERWDGDYSSNGGKDNISYTSREDAINKVMRDTGISREEAAKMVDEYIEKGNIKVKDGYRYPNVTVESDNSVRINGKSYTPTSYESAVHQWSNNNIVEVGGHKYIITRIEGDRVYMQEVQTPAGFSMVNGKVGEEFLYIQGETKLQ